MMKKCQHFGAFFFYIFNSLVCFGFVWFFLCVSKSISGGLRGKWARVPPPVWFFGGPTKGNICGRLFLMQGAVLVSAKTMQGGGGGGEDRRPAGGETLK